MQFNDILKYTLYIVMFCLNEEVMHLIVVLLHMIADVIYNAFSRTVDRICRYVVQQTLAIVAA